MGFFRSTKGSIISDSFKLVEKVANYAPNYMYDLALYEDHLEVTPLSKANKLILNYDQITDVFYGTQTQLVEKPKSVIGRALVGGILFSGIGAVVGAVSGAGTKTKEEIHFYLIISYTSQDGQDKYLQFEDTRMYKGSKVAAKLKELVDIKPDQQGDIIL